MPVRSRWDSTFASEHMRRCVTSAFDISSVNSATGVSPRTARFAAMQSARPDFPMLGPRGEDDEVAGLEAGREVVDVLEAGQRRR